ncbi:ABC transporter substrate-binding protein [Dermacoccaceae bacterium W4C1]
MRWTKVLAFTAAGALSLSACGGGGSSSNNSSGGAGGTDDGFSGVEATAAFKPNAKGPAAIPAGAKKGGTLTLNAQSVPENMDPSTQYFQDSAMILRLTNRSLTQYKQEGDKSVLVPDLATNLGEQSKDGLQWKFTLKKGLKYEDGTAIKASDIEYSVKRSFETEKMPGGPTFQLEYLKGGDSYKGPWTQPNAKFPGITSDDEAGTITFNLSKKMQTFPYFASFTMFGPIPKAKDTKTNYQLKWLATGPYKIKTYNKGSSLTLTKNTNWDADSDPARNQLPDTIQFNFGRDTATTAKSIMASNGVDATTLSYDGVDASILSDATGDKKNQVASGPSPCVSWSGASLDTQKIPLAVRKAIQTAWPTRQIMQAAGITQFDAAQGGSIGAPQIPGFTDEKAEGQPIAGTGDAAAAKKMLQAAGEEGFTLSYYYTNDQESTKKVQAVKQPALEKAGFTVKAIGVSSSEIRAKIKDAKAPTNMGNGVGTGWCYDWPAGDSIYPAIFNSTLPTNTGVGNVKDKALDKEMAAISALPITEQGAKWAALDKKIREEIVPAVVMYHSKGSAIFGTKVHNVKIDPNAGGPTLTNVWVG